MEAPDPPEYRGRVVRVRREHYTLPDGRPASLDAVRYRHVAVVVPLLPDGRVVLLRQFRPIVAAVLWEVPAGTIEPGEAPEACARRELGEEAGYRAGRLEPLGEALADPGLTDERLFLFVARDLASVPRHLDADEQIEVTAVPLAEAYRMIERGEILDAGTLVALLRLRLRSERASGC
ncbi:MAG TPA: NUDIX hydrolase [Methylomirabilota bacterium]|nr:NUDIX hydrolase [Methylomirabilota bacterium]